MKRYTQDVEAYRLYLQGRYYWNKRPQPEFSKALECYEQAIARDPTFALAFAGIADYYGSLGSWEFGGLPPREAFPRAKAAVERALALDDSLPEAHSSMGHLQLHYDWNAAAAAAAFGRALALNPSYTNAHHYLSHLHLSCGRVAESLDESLRSIEIDPLDQILVAHLAWHYVFARQYDLAIEQCDRTQAMGDNFWPFFFRGCALEQKGDLDAALVEFTEAKRGSPSSTFALTAAAHAHGLAGRRQEAQALREELLGRRFVPSYDRAIIHLGLGEREDALTALEQAPATASGPPGWPISASIPDSIRSGDSPDSRSSSAASVWLRDSLHSMTIAQGSRLGPYEVVGLLGTRGMGEVYRARDPRLGRGAAIKVLPPAQARP